MGWDAEVTSVDDAGGRLTVVVRIYDGRRELSETFVTTQGGDADWLKRSVARKVADLDSVTALREVIEVGPLPLDEPASDRTADDDPLRAAYAADMARYKKYLDASRGGLSLKNVAEFDEIKQRLQDNMQPAYLDLW